MKNILAELRSQHGWTPGDLAFAIAALFALPIERIFRAHRQVPRFADAKPGVLG
jgi:DNA-binding XRE family transcriptional regulator